MKTLRILASAGLVACALVVASGAMSGVASASVAKNCTSAHLKVSLGVSQGAAGTIYHPIVFTNRGPACAIWGVPAVRAVVGGASHSRVPVGPFARNLSMGEMAVRQVVKTGHTVSDNYGVIESGNYTPSTCVSKNASAVVVTLGRFVNHAYLPLKISVCTKIASTTTTLIVQGSQGY